MAITSLQDVLRYLDADGRLQQAEIAGRLVEIGPLAGRHVAPARIMDDPARPVAPAEYLLGLPSAEHEASGLFSPSDA